MANAPKSQYERVTWKRAGYLEGTSRGKMPWPNSRWRWLLPLLGLLFMAVAMIWTITHIQGDIEQAAEDILIEQGIDTTDLEFDADYRDIEVKGTLPAGVDPEEVKRLLEDEVGLEDINDRDVENDDEDDNKDGEDIRKATITATAAVAAPAALGPLSVNAASDGETITLTGTVPSQEDRDSLVAQAEATGLTVVDELTVSGLEPQSADAPGQIRQLNSIVGGLTAGTFVAANLAIGDDGPVTGSIQAATSADAGTFTTLAGDGVDVSSPPELGALDTEVTYDGTRIVLNGTVLTAEQAASLETAAADVVGANNVVNNLEISDLDEAVDGSDGRVEALSAAIGTFTGLSSADATMNDTDLTVNGEAPDDASRAATVTAVSAAETSGLRPGGEITVAAAPEPELSLQEEIDLLQAELDALQEEIRENVVFASDSDVLTSDAQSTLDKVVSAMERYTRPVVEVGGHTDSQGDDAYNAALSQRRAESVVTYITESIEPDRLSPVGFGESQPVADNNTEAGRLQNRRVGLIAKENF